MADDKKYLVPSSANLPDFSGTPIPSSDIELPSTGSWWDGTSVDQLKTDTAFITQHTQFLQARALQANSLCDLIDARAAVAVRQTELQRSLHELREQRAHQTFAAAHARDKERVVAAYELKILAADMEARLAQARTHAIEADRGALTAATIKQTEMQRSFDEARARANEARALYQETIADLGEPATESPPPGARARNTKR